MGVGFHGGSLRVGKGRPRACGSGRSPGGPVRPADSRRNFPELHVVQHPRAAGALWPPSSSRTWSKLLVSCSLCEPVTETSGSPRRVRPKSGTGLSQLCACGSSDLSCERRRGRTAIEGPKRRVPSAHRQGDRMSTVLPPIRLTSSPRFRAGKISVVVRKRIQDRFMALRSG